MLFVSPKSAKQPDLNLKLFISPSFSPVYYNDPGFSILHLDIDPASNKFKIGEITIEFLHLSNAFMYSQFVWRKFSMNDEMGIDIDSSS